MPSSEKRLYPPLTKRIYSVWYRHFRVYTKNLISNGLPPFLEPLIFLAGIGLGMGQYINNMEGVPYITFLATGLPITAAMFTSSYECTYGTFIRLEFDRVYDGMLASPLKVWDILTGEIIWAGTKGFFFSLAVTVIVTLFGLVPLPWSFLTPIIGFFTGMMFASISLLITSFVTNINHFNFYFTGFLSPMFFFSGVIFPLENLPATLRIVAEFFPLTHSVRTTRALDLGTFPPVILYDLLVIAVFTIATAWPAIGRLKKRLIT